MSKFSNKSRKTAAGVLGFIAAHPDQHQQGSWVSDMFVVRESKDICGTTLCAAGTAIFVTKGVKGLLKTWDRGDFEGDGAEALDLYGDEARALFYMMDNARVIEGLTLIAQGKRKKFRALFGLDEVDPW